MVSCSRFGVPGLQKNEAQHVALRTLKGEQHILFSSFMGEEKLHERLPLFSKAGSEYHVGHPTGLSST
jgi:hypothetical protein